MLKELERRQESGVARSWRPSLGACPEAGGTRFRVWAPKAVRIEVVAERAGETLGVYGLDPDGAGYHSGLVPGIRPGDRYRYRIDGGETYPDPASRFQPEGVHGPSEVIDPAQFRWSDAAWRGIEPEDLVIYELHVGTFTPEGRFDGVTSRLEQLRDLGVTAIELMPLADFAGDRSWGYDGVDLFAPARCYGQPDDLRRLVDEAHRLGLGVILDVVYNHFGPVGNYTSQYSGQYLSERESAWAACVNLDGEGSENVKAFFIENALHWLHEYHLDGLRLDATHALHDDTPPHFLAELADAVHRSVPGRRVHLIAEDHRNLNLMIRPREQDGWGLDGVWADDFHHVVRRILAGDDEGYYRDYRDSTADLARTIEQGWLYTGQPSIHLAEPRGTDPAGIEPRRFVICLQNHDQVGNRAFGDRLHHAVDLAAYRAASAVLLCAAETPLLFMGQEWAATTPFCYFTDHDEALGKLVTEGRRKEFAHFRAFTDPAARDRIPDPQAASTFEQCRLDWTEPEREPHAGTWRLYREWLRLRRVEPALRSNRREAQAAGPLGDDALWIRREGPAGERLLLVALLRGAGRVELPERAEAGLWEPVVTTEDGPFAHDARPIRFEIEPGSRASLTFARPGTVLLRQVKGRQGAGPAGT